MPVEGGQQKEKRMTMRKFQRLGLWVSIAAASALLAAPVAFADGGRGDQQDRGRGSDEHALVVQQETTTVSMDRDNSVNEDANEQVNEDRDGLQVVSGQSQAGVDNDQEVNDLNDDID
jgi:hypothetical protein